MCKEYQKWENQLMEYKQYEFFPLVSHLLKKVEKQMEKHKKKCKICQSEVS